MNAAALKLQMDMAERQFDHACIGLRRARADYDRSRSKKRAAALAIAQDAYDVALSRFKRAASVHSKALAAEVAMFKASVAPQNQQMDFFA